MTKKLNFGHNFGPFGPNLDPKIFLLVLHLLDVRHRAKKPHFGPDLGPLGPN